MVVWQRSLGQEVDAVFGSAFAAQVAYVPTGGPGADEKAAGDGFCRPGPVADRPGFVAPGGSGRGEKRRMTLGKIPILTYMTVIQFIG